jgi:hypothetical protein
MDEVNSNVNAIQLEAQTAPFVNYVLFQNKVPIVYDVLISNSTDMDLEGVELTISSNPEFCDVYKRTFDFIPKNSDFKIDDIKLIVNAEYLAELSEKISGYINISLSKADEELISKTYDISVLAFDQWPGVIFNPGLLASFVTPNNPAIVKILSNASELLGKWTGDPSLDAYQTQDPNRVLKQAAAVYGALQKENINYVVPPASFDLGQRVRLCDAVIDQKMGTCLDLTLLYASCLEQAGLNPILILQKGHIFSGVWLEDKVFSNLVVDDASEITKRLADGVSEIAVVECTAFVSGKNVSFDDACESVISKVKIEESIEYIIDVKRARYSNITPMPSRIKDVDGWKIVKDEVKEVTKAPTKIETYDYDIPDKENKLTKIDQWERKLLDLGLRNSLINMRLSKNMVPILTSSIDDIEDALSDGSDFRILSKPNEIEIVNDDVNFETLNNIGNIKSLIDVEFKNKRLRSPYSEGELEKRIKNLYRTSKLSLEENGANTLYLALGLLKWFETPKSQKARYAPIILVPVEMIRKSASQGYIIRLRDDDPQVNITLLEKLKQDFQITINGLDPIPQDEHGIDTRKIFTIFRQSIMSQNRWDVMETAYVGIFSFSQFVMWNDMRNRSDDLLKNKVVKSLVDGKLAWEAEPMEIGEKVSEEDVILPISADASQVYAIKSACEGKSFVLHGPPGTGKSQTITALIANALANGKTVLFVAEKMAALEVVQNRLEKIGLGPFCLELHSNKSKKKDVLGQLQTASEVTKYTSAEAYARKADEISALRKELDSYANQLHIKRNCGYSIHELINLYEQYKNSKDFDVKVNSDINWITETVIDEQINSVERLIAAAKIVGHPCSHALKFVGVCEYSQKFRVEVPQLCNSIKSTLNALRISFDDISSALQLSYNDTFESYNKVYLLSKELVKWQKYPSRWCNDTNLNHYLTDINILANHFIKANSLKEKLLSVCTDELLLQDGNQLLNDYNVAISKSFISKAIAVKKFNKKIKTYFISNETNIDLPELLNDLVVYQQENTSANDMLEFYKLSLGDLYLNENTDWQKIIDLTKEAFESQSQIINILGNDDVRIRFSSNKQISNTVENFKINWDLFVNSYNKLCDDLQITIDKNSIDWSDTTINICDNLLNNYDLLKDWTTWTSVAKEAKSLGLDYVVNAYENGMEHSDVKNAYFKHLYKNLAIYTIDATPSLNSFSGTMFTEKIKQFKKLDDEVTMLSKQEIYCRLASKIPNFTREASKSSEIGILQRAIKSNGRGLSIRNLFEQIPSLLPHLCPCMLVSPISAAQYLDPKNELFDLVVFDEASQLPTSKAVGALARGKNAIIVGDPKQMPPTSFFMSNKVDEDNLDTEDLESILDDCLALNMPQTHLLWHYRSRHESLIAFSNNQFYSNKLYTFPSVNDRESKVSLVHVDGYFDRGKKRVNRAEAVAVVEELKRRAKDKDLSKQSVGIVTFNISQQELIDDLFTEECAKDEALEKWAYDSSEPIFIKNLENVQGDERDVILFSIAYAPDESGKMYMNFGPLNRDGGWRRLNVAVSRARSEMIVFATLLPEQINLSKTSADGVIALKNFLEYAQGKCLALDINTAKREYFDSLGIIDTICEFLNEKGYQTDKFVGHSEYRIDIGVVDPKNDDNYILGILLDGNSYETSKTTRDREVSQIDVLNGLGWKIHRVWSMDWWDNSDKELEKIIEAIETKDDTENDIAITNDNESVLSDNVNSAQAFAPVTVAKERTIKVYEIAELSYSFVNPDELVCYTPASFAIDTKIKEVLSVEAPICESLLIRRITQSLGISRAGNRIQRYMTMAFNNFNLTSTKDAINTIYWDSSQNPVEYFEFRSNGEGDNKRDFKEIPIIEIENAICYVLYKEFGMPKEDLIRRTANVLGYTRLGNNVTFSINSAFNSLISKNRIKLSDNNIVNLTDDEYDLQLKLDK